MPEEQQADPRWAAASAEATKLFEKLALQRSITANLCTQFYIQPVNPDAALLSLGGAGAVLDTTGTPVPVANVTASVGINKGLGINLVAFLTRYLGITEEEIAAAKLQNWPQP